MKLILPEQITEAQYKAYLEDWGTERIVPIASANPKGLSFEDWRAESIKRRVRVPKGYVPKHCSSSPLIRKQSCSARWIFAMH